VLVAVPALLGYERYVISGESMAGTYERGSLVYSERVPVGELRIGDVITFPAPRGAGLVTHRIVALGRTPRGRLVARTQGDEARALDPWRVRLDEAEHSRAVLAVPHVGVALESLGASHVRGLLIGLPLLILLLLWTRGGVRPAGIPTP
jgi:signal peptidase